MEIMTPTQYQRTVHKHVNSDTTEPLFLVGKKNKKVVISVEEYESWKETLEIMSNPYLRDKIEQGMKEPASECTPIEELMDLS